MISTTTRKARTHPAVCNVDRTSVESMFKPAPREDSASSVPNHLSGFCPTRAITSGGTVHEPAPILRTVRSFSGSAGGAGAADRRAPGERHRLGEQGRD